MGATALNDPFQTMPAVVGLAGFVVATIVGISVDNPPVVVVGRGVAALVACGVLGAIVAPIIAKLVRDHAERTRAAQAPADDSGSDVEIVEETAEKVRKAA